MVDSVQELEEALWPQMQGLVEVSLEVFRVAALDVLQESQKKFLVLDNEECALLLEQARSRSS
jgi:hypothetical protein